MTEGVAVGGNEVGGNGVSLGIFVGTTVLVDTTVLVGTKVLVAANVEVLLGFSVTVGPAKVGVGVDFCFLPDIVCDQSDPWFCYAVL